MRTPQEWARRFFDEGRLESLRTMFEQAMAEAAAEERAAGKAEGHREGLEAAAKRLATAAERHDNNAKAERSCSLYERAAQQNAIATALRSEAQALLSPSAAAVAEVVRLVENTTQRVLKASNMTPAAEVVGHIARVGECKLCGDSGRVPDGIEYLQTGRDKPCPLCRKDSER